MYKKSLILLLTLLMAVSARPDNKWTYYGAYHNSLANIAVGDEVFSLCDGSIFSYSTADNEVKVYDKTTGLSDVDIEYMLYCEQLGCFVLVYSNSNIDVFYPQDQKVANMPQFMNSSLADKTVNDATIEGTNLYLATNTGITVADLSRLEFSKTYSLDTQVRSAACIDGTIYAATATEVLQGNTSDNLLDPSKWTRFSGAVFNKIRAYAGNLYGWAVYVFRLDMSTGGIAFVNTSQADFLCTDKADNMFFGNANEVFSVAADGTPTQICGSNDFKYLSYAGGSYWASRGYNGTQQYRLDSSGLLQAAADGITLNSPMRNYCAFMNISPSGRLLVAGGSRNYNNLDYQGTLYAFDNNKFTNFDDSVSSYTGYRYLNLTGVAEDPADPDHVFAVSAESGLYEFRAGKYVNHYGHTNSPLKSVLPNDVYSYLYVRLSALQYDPYGNLWMINNEVDTILRIYTSEGKWRSIYIDELAKYPTFDHMIFDNSGRAWFTHRRTTGSHTAGVACLDFNGTVGNTSDDTFTYRYRFTNEDGTTYTPNTVDAICKDNDGRIWVGTVEGPFLIENPDEFSNVNFTFEQVKVPRNDGTDNADYLLTGVPISAIAVDAGNRKWFGTNGDGLYLVSADNIETVYHFTSTNSPLVSNIIKSLAVDPETGLVMIGTDKGLMSYDAGKVNSSNKLKDKDLKIYPNPVRPDYYGDVTIEGLPLNAEVKITTTGGQLVCSGKAPNGFYKWDVKDSNGYGVGSGVYYVLAVTSDGKHGGRGRIVVVR